MNSPTWTARWQATAARLHQHRTGALWGVAALATASTVTAVAVAPLAANDTVPELQWVSQPVQSHGLTAQLDALANQGLRLSRSDVTRSNDTVGGLLQRLGVQDASAVALLRNDPTAKRVLTGRAGKLVQATTDERGRLVELVARFPSEQAALVRSHFNRLRIQADAAGQLEASVEQAAYSTQPRLVAGVIKTTLFAATDEAGVPEPVATQLVDLFGEVDFHRSLRRGDSFELVFEALLADGQPVPWADGAGRILAAEFVNKGRAHHAVWFATAAGKGEYFGMDGKSKRSVFLASPLEFSRVTSGFAMRLHPLTRQWRAHLGVDYSAPNGTPVRAVGESQVEFAGVRGGYGNVVELRHNKTQTTVYAHLSSIAVKVGQTVAQGQSIGAVGATGWATGPHLHFEFRVNGEHQDPQQLAMAGDGATVLDAQARQRFADHVRGMREQLALAESLVGARRRVE